MNAPRTPPRFVPTLTEVVEFQEAQVLDDGALLVADTGADAPAVVPVAAPMPAPPMAPPAAAPAVTPAVVPVVAPVVAPIGTAAATPAVPAAVSTIAPTTLIVEDVPAFLLAAQATAATASAAAPAAAESSAAEPIAVAAEAISHEREEQIVQAVLTELQRRTDLMLEYRLRETLAPSLARLTDALIKEVRHDLAATLRDVVARAVAQELTRHRPK